MVVLRVKSTYLAPGFISAVKTLRFQLEAAFSKGRYISRCHKWGKNRSKRKLSLDEINYIKRKISTNENKK